MRDTGRRIRAGCCQGEDTLVWCMHPVCSAGRADVPQPGRLCRPRSCKYFEAAGASDHSG